ncbi:MULTISPECIES: precorrin-3B C(17)-methyltransferase [unclassified Tolypothrix]|uniref:precorrin-3B C(17)-methyltransferase n=1 Tax=unclassified Tolypothrix TaxID=2649714 RepID=UPI0005EAC4D9|nr:MULTISPECIES: precorrin-3B C(17)-methyltransferase [unclassified Tolypothrix]BAY88493.1 cobalamin biosynthesis precorrin-3 methylase [Microchaete diplosiphon NIES-3275]EKF02425.1 precorrin-3B C17-methyltransferase [Tolypothrix sp. PCC 7601]MBE9084512.1 precorrin-3B C(17)-methyltransferase [Tolypothrix sp. LEGE 11397]UYD29173.1 precorrin-3B C(17)-methyltransferase [Tolypothrix sp. PCC 7712]UYD34914.1 precorrin-3B C(17)-methyltransferase [Tolypothrix sp. PCC 7601]
MMSKVAPAVVVLGQNSVAVGRKIISVLPGATLYGLAGRTSEVDVSFSNFGETVRELFAQGSPVIGICAAGILIRTLAPMISDKRQEPPVIAVAEDGSAVVPLLGGLSGVNDLARRIAEIFDIKAAITTTGDIRFRTALLSPPAGYHLANPDDAKKFISDLLAGAKVKLEGTAPWLTESQLPIDPNGELTIKISDRLLKPTPNCLVYHPPTIAIAICETSQTHDQVIASVWQLLGDAELAPASIAGVFAPIASAAYPAIHAVAEALGVPARFFTPNQLENLLSHGYSPVQAAAIAATSTSAQLIEATAAEIAIAISPQPMDPSTIGQPRGRLAVIGTGPGSSQWMSPEVKEILKSATDLVGYTTYLNLVGSLAEGKRRHDSDNREEISRAELALDLAAEGRYVAVVSSGDPGIYAMATAIFEVLDYHPKPEWDSIDIHVAPGISAMQAAAASIGAPLGHDFCAISLSDILKPWSIIAERITAAAQADFAIAFYNPVSKERTWQLSTARNILLRYRTADTPVVLARNLGRSGQAVRVITLEELTPELADMRTIILIGSSKTRKIQRLDGSVSVYTPRRYS